MLKLKNSKNVSYTNIYQLKKEQRKQYDHF